MSNFILKTDSYKLGHWSQYPEGTTGVYSYLEARQGAEFDKTVFVGLEQILRQIQGRVVTENDVRQADDLAAIHFGSDNAFNYDGWMHIVKEHDGRLPVVIKAVPEGSVIPTGNVLMTVENTCPKCFWLTNALESFLLHVWYPTTVASLSRSVKEMLAQKLEATGCSLDGLPFMLHDFGYRSATTDDAAAIGGLGHLVNFMGTDTLPALLLAVETYGANPRTLGFSVPATEHSVMTALGAEGEFDQVQRLLDANPTGIISCVADSYNIYDFVDMICLDHGLGGFRETILHRDGKFVVRPDSTTAMHPTPDLLVVDLLDRLWDNFGGTTNDADFKVLDPHIGILWGDGIDPHGIEKILNRMMLRGYAASNIVFGMGGGLLQKVNRDTQRFAFKCSAQERDGVWHDVQKKPLDATKTSKAGRLALMNDGGILTTVAERDLGFAGDMLEIRFKDGDVFNSPTFDEIRKRAELLTLAETSAKL
jgi:nicotinamide phosphoribosyltransferase